MKRAAALLLLAATLARAEGGPLPGEQLLGPGQLAPLPADARVEMDAKKAAGYFADGDVPDAERLALTKGRGL